MIHDGSGEFSRFVGPSLTSPVHSWCREGGERILLTAGTGHLSAVYQRGRSSLLPCHSSNLFLQHKRSAESRRRKDGSTRVGDQSLRSSRVIDLLWIILKLATI